MQSGLFILIIIKYCLHIDVLLLIDLCVNSAKILIHFRKNQVSGVD